MNKNRLCSKTCGVDIDIEDKKRSSKKRGIILIEEIINMQKNEWNNGREDIFFTKPLDPTPREIWPGSDGSHPEEKYGLEATDPTPKENQGGR